MVIQRALGKEFRKRFPLYLLKSFWTHPTKQRHLHLFASSWTPYYYASYKKFCRSTSNTCIGQVPSMGESITEGMLSSWSKEVGDVVNKDDVLAIIDTDKVSVDIHSIAQGRLIDQKAKAGDAVFVGQDLYVLDLSIQHGKVDETVHEKSKMTESSTTSSTNTQSIPQDVSEPVHKSSDNFSEVPSAASQGDQRPQKTLETSQHIENSSHQSEPQQPVNPTRENTHKEKPTKDLNTFDSTSERQDIVVPMTRLRKTIAHRLKMAQNLAASLTTFNECDMTNVMAMRSELQEEFIKRHGYKLGFVSFFLHAASRALLQSPEINAYISENGHDIIYKNYVDISVAVSTPSGLLVPVLRDCHKKSIAGLEGELQKYAEKAREGKISLQDMTGGTFTISNGGIFGSLMGTPLLNYPQTSILGLHSITPRATVVKNQVVARPMMYLALTYDHRLVDGKEAVTFLNTIKKHIEDPRRLLLDL